MSKSVKVAISLPEKEFREIEALRKREKIGRSLFVLRAIQFWRETKEKETLVRIYQEGYRKMPENLKELGSWEKVSADSFSEDGW